MAEVAGNARAYSNGGVWTAVAGSTAPTDPISAYSASFYEVGLLSDKGLTEAHAITSTDKYAWQNAQLVRTLRSAEKRTWAFEALEENAMVRRLMYPIASISSGAGTNEVQTITLTATGGTFTVSYNGQTTSAITASASLPTTAALQTALQGLTSIGAGNVLVTGTAGSSYVLTYSGTLAAANVPQASLGVASLTGGTATIATTTPGASPVTTTVVKPNTAQNLRVFGIDLIDGGYIRRTIINNGEAVDSGDRSYTATDLTVVGFTLTAYPDTNGVSWTEYSNNPALAATVA